MGYNLKSKGYRLFTVKKNKVIISRDVLFNEKASWDWQGKEVQDQVTTFNEESENQESEDEEVFEAPQPSPNSPSSSSSTSPSSTPRRMKSLNDVHASCNFCVVEPESFEEAWKKAMEEEIYVIEKNKN